MPKEPPDSAKIHWIEEFCQWQAGDTLLANEVFDAQLESLAAELRCGPPAPFAGAGVQPTQPRHPLPVQ